jgi:pimeloyl-ACP methyl ester carboxylesterase
MRDRTDNQHVLKEFAEDFLLIAGSRDEFIPVESLRNLQSQHDVQLFVLKDIGHLGMLEAPEASAKIIRNFIAH